MKDTDPTIAVRIKVDVASTGSGGKIKSTKNNKKTSILKQVSGGFKRLLGIMTKQGNLQMSGMMKGSSSSGLGFIGTLVGIVAGLFASATVPGSTADFEQMQNYLGATDQSYQVIDYEGEQYVALINNKTGEINDLMSQREAFEKGIIDEKSKIKDHLITFQSKTFDSLSNQERKEFIIKSIARELNNTAELAGYNSKQREQLNKAIEDAIKARKAYLDSLKSGPTINFADIPGEANTTKKINKNPVTRLNYLIGGDQIASAIKMANK